jgi:glycosyltransferase involved in cell wall biosynthesis
VRILCPPESRLYSESRSWAVPVEPLAIAKKSVRGLGALYRWFKANRCDVVNTHSSTDSWLSALALRALGRPFPIVRTRHISAPVSPGWLSHWLYAKAAECVVTTGEELRKQLIAANRISPEKVVSVPTGADAARFRPGDRSAARQQLALPTEPLLVGIVATLRSWKGHGYLIEAMKLLPASVHLVIVGDGPMREVLERQVAELALGERVRMTGNQSDVLPWLQALDVFALPSYANEGVPQALAQAMLCGLACVTTHAGSIAELARDGDTTLVVPARDAQALARAIGRLRGDAALRAKLGAAARAHCAANFSLERMLDRMEAIYAEVSGA